MPSTRRVFMTGATGFVGRAVIQALRSECYAVRCLARRGSERELRGREAFDRVEGNVLARETLERGMAGCDAVIHLVGIIRGQPATLSTFERIHTQGTVNVLDSAAATGVRRYLHMSALGSRPNARSRYHKTKWAAEEAVRSSPIAWTIFRPSIIYGRGDEFVNMLAWMIQRYRGVVPVIGGGLQRLQPVAREHVAASFARAPARPGHAHGDGGGRGAGGTRGRRRPGRPRPGGTPPRPAGAGRRQRGRPPRVHRARPRVSHTPRARSHRRARSRAAAPPALRASVRRRRATADERAGRAGAHAAGLLAALRRRSRPLSGRARRRAGDRRGIRQRGPRPARPPLRPLSGATRRAPTDSRRPPAPGASGRSLPAARRGRRPAGHLPRRAPGAAAGCRRRSSCPPGPSWPGDPSAAVGPRYGPRPT